MKAWTARAAAMVVGLGALAIGACSDDAAPTNPEVTFPADFLWGTATAGFQNDPGCPTLAPEVCEDRASDWYQWVHDPDLVADPTVYVTGEPLSHGPGTRELYPEQLAEARNVLHTNAIRVSIEWSRLFPNAEAEGADTVDALEAFADPAGVAYYEALFEAARKAKLTLLVTLNHYTLPLWIHDGKACHADLDGCKDRGWLDHDRIVRAIALYAGYCGRKFGKWVDLWATLNEPFATVLAGYVFPSAERSHPPGVALRLDDAIDVLFNEIDAHGKMVDAVRAEDHVDADGDGKAARVGTVQNLVAARAVDPTAPGAADAARHASWIINEVFLEGTAAGRIDRNLDGVIEETRADLVGRMDFIGINYYTRLDVTPAGAPVAAAYPWFDFFPNLEAGFNVTFPEGMLEVLRLGNRYGVPLIITENGTPDPAPDAGDTYLVPHLRYVAQAIAEGIPVEGYFYWTLVDNYEWNHGMAMKLGLFALDIDTKARTLRPIGAKYAEIVKARGF
ncbi:MAG: family 1 glycosylhydrolase [Myxococcota bacterium]